MRDDVARRMREGDVFSNRAPNYYNHFATLCKLIDRGDPSIGLPPYNGGLFSPDAAPLLKPDLLPDADVAPVVHGLSQTTSNGEPRFVNYRDMSVQQLGSIYQRLLEQEPVRGEDGSIGIRPNTYARKDSGSFYTPQDLVDLIVDRTLKPLADERRAAFEAKAAELKSDRRSQNERRAELRKLDPAEAVLGLKVLDPAMGSGHFLVTSVDFLSDAIAELVESAPAAAPWLQDPYESPLVRRVDAVRADILRRAGESGWVIDESLLTDRAIIRRMVLKRCIYGVDKNPLTVELAKVSLWLHSFTTGAPLSFLDHHLRHGDSLLGLSVQDGLKELRRLSGLFASNAIAHMQNAAKSMQLIEDIPDIDLAEVHESANLFHLVQNSTAELRGLLDFLCGLRWLTAEVSNRARREIEEPLVDLLEQNSQCALELLAHGPEYEGPISKGNLELSLLRFEEVWENARAIARREAFLHWEVAFPAVWQDWQSDRLRGGFDAIVGNPPWDRIKLQEVEWFATRDPELARASTAAARRESIKRLRDEDDPLATEFDAAKEQSDGMGRLVRASNQYPLLGGGDINLYSLFVERAMTLSNPSGLVGLLTPSGIYADKTASSFFRSISTAGRVSSLFDFENKRVFFKDVHPSFKFCALVFGGDERTFPQTECAFFLHDTRTVSDGDRCFPLDRSDFERVNPNTGTAPVFRARRDAEITRGIYQRHQVLVNRSGGRERRAWPVKYRTMFHMANSSHLFRTTPQLDDDGFYPVEGNRWKRGSDLFLPLYEGKMVQAFDHRAASITTQEGHLFRPGQPDRTLKEEHLDPDFSPRPRYWVDQQAHAATKTFQWFLAFKDVTASTNLRTMIAAIVPTVGCGHTLPVLLPSDEMFDAEEAACYLANFNSFGFDFVTRQKVHATHLTWYIVEQLPVIAPADYDRRFGDETARDLVRRHVLELTYTAHDMQPFARDLGEPFEWNEEDRRHLRARLDALYFHLYGLSRDAAAYVLDTFPIVRRQDEAQFGHYRTRDLILAYMNALAAGDTTTVVSL